MRTKAMSGDMSWGKKWWVRFAAGMMVGLFAVAAVVVAGPPLICHAFDIGNAKSLPWVSHDWNLSGGENYNTAKLADDTIAILEGSPKATLVHMETLRRATLYARKDSQAAKQLLARLMARAEAAQNAKNPDALAIFDAGYLAESYKQWLGEGGQNPANGLDGYAQVKRALQLGGNDGEMEFAAALISLRGPEAGQREHAARAIAGAKTDELLARNLNSHFLGQSQTMAEMITGSAETKVARQ
ncbi:MAG TPA: hypothetical protein VLC94_04105 [Candidatus Acidoferrum sp.]|nr:hypothetical protein [Candidatus Acidoferrum sp.]